MKMDKKTEKKMATKMVRAIREGDNVTAYKELEKLMKQKIAKHVDKVLKDVD
jgi:hypothetical protein